MPWKRGEDSGRRPDADSLRRWRPGGDREFRRRSRLQDAAKPRNQKIRTVDIAPCWRPSVFFPTMRRARVSLAFLAAPILGCAGEHTVVPTSPSSPAKLARNSAANVSPANNYPGRQTSATSPSVPGAAETIPPGHASALGDPSAPNELIPLPPVDGPSVPAIPTPVAAATEPPSPEPRQHWWMWPFNLLRKLDEAGARRMPADYTPAEPTPNSS